MTPKRKSQDKTGVFSEGEAFRLMFENHPLPMLVYDAETLDYLSANNAAAELYGCPREELERMNVADLLPEDELLRLREILKTEDPPLRTSSVWRNRRKDGSLIFVEVSSHTFSYNGRKAILLAAQDVTRRRQTEEILVKLKKAVDLSNDVVFMTDVDGVFTYVNPAFTALYGYAPEETVGKTTPRILKSGFNASEIYAELWSSLTGGRAFQRMILNKKKNGKLVDVSVSASPVTDEDGKVIGYLSIQRDVSERVQSEEALRRAEENYRSIFDNAAIGIYQSTPQGHFLDVNPAMARIFGYDSPQEMLESVEEIQTQYYVHPADRGEFERLIQAHDRVSDFCALCRRKDGSHIWVEENARVVRDKHGNILYYEGFVADITAQKQAEEGLRRAKESLESANRELGDVLARERHLARTDGLTGLYNYRHFFEAATREFEAARRYRYPVSILMFDADGFKKINDTRGHLFGDALLTQLGGTIAAQMRSSDMLARYGGDEFVALLSRADARQAFAIAERIRQSAESFRMWAGEEEISVTLSVGVCELRWQSKDGVEQIVQRADNALYAAKRAGRNCVVVYRDE